MLKIDRIMEALSNEDDRRAVAFEVWRAYGGPLVDLKRAVEQGRRATARNRLEGLGPDDPVPLLSHGNADNTRTELGQGGRVSPTPPSTPVFQIPESIKTALSKCEFLGKIDTFYKPEWWRAEIRANAGVNYAAELLKAEAWIQSHADRRPRKRVGQFMHRWLSRADRGGQE